MVTRWTANRLFGTAKRLWWNRQGARHYRQAVFIGRGHVSGLVANGPALASLKPPREHPGFQELLKKKKDSVQTAPNGGAVVLWETAAPDGRYQPGINSEAARKVVDELHQKHGFYYQVIDKLQADKALDEPVRKLALQIANSRKWQDAQKLNDESWDVVRSSTGEPNAYKEALNKAEKAVSLEPNSPNGLNTLGVAQYRVGAYQDALTTLSRADKMRTDANEPSAPEDLAFVAMSLHKLGRADEAKAALKRLRALCKEERFAEDQEAQAFLTEAEQLITGEKQ